MDRNEELISKRYDALMFARTPEEAKRAARLLADAVLGEEGLTLPLERAMKEVCRKIRPASDPRDQARFEAEFLELVFAPTNGEGSPLGANNSNPGRSKAA
jgi:hypothetical protein